MRPHADDMPMHVHLFGCLSAAKLTEGAYFDLSDDNSKTFDFVTCSKTTEG